MLAVAGGKGGVGKTTTALALATALARRGADPVVADADRAMPNLHVAADTPAAPGAAALAAGRPLATACHPSATCPGVRVLPTPPGTGESELRGAFHRLAAAVAAEAPGAHAPVLLDCPAGAGRDAALPLQVADAVLLVSTSRRASLVDAAKTAAMAHALGAPPVGCVLTRTTAPPADVERLLGCPVLSCVPTVSRPLTGPRTQRAFDVLAADICARNV